MSATGRHKSSPVRRAGLQVSLIEEWQLTRCPSEFRQHNSTSSVPFTRRARSAVSFDPNDSLLHCKSDDGDRHAHWSLASVYIWQLTCSSVTCDICGTDATRTPGLRVSYRALL